ncbi:hypothetical protein [Kibdelosporangium philippinense]|uniref:hypothetical protein n=1 Tax=Kibdelosporangium philippinense TaxID=211113 RepID=UPI003607362A
MMVSGFVLTNERRNLSYAGHEQWLDQNPLVMRCEAVAIASRRRSRCGRGPQALQVC